MLPFWTTKYTARGGGKERRGRREGGRGDEGYLAMRLECATRSKVNDYCRESLPEHTLGVEFI